MNSNISANVEVNFMWPISLGLDEKKQISDLIKLVSSSDPIVGFQQHVEDQEIKDFFNSIESELISRKKVLMLGKAHTNELLCMAVLTQNSSPNNRHIADLSKGMIHPEHRGSGLLKASLKEIVEKSKSLNIDLLTLDVRDGTRAQKIWLASGFRIYGTLDDYARSGNQSHKGHYMAQSVEELENRLMTS